MARYQVWVTITNQTGTRHPRPQRVSWGASRVEPAATLGGEPESDYDHVSERGGVLSGFYECVKDAESRGEAIARDDIEVSVERVSEIVKRGNVVNARRSNPGGSTTSHRDAFDEIMKRPRPL